MIFVSIFRYQFIFFFLKIDKQHQFIFSVNYFSKNSLLIGSQNSLSQIFSTESKHPSLLLCTLVRKRDDKKSLVNIKYGNLGSFKNEVILNIPHFENFKSPEVLGVAQICLLLMKMIKW